MAISKYERDVFVLKLGVKVHPNPAPAVTIEEILQILNEAYEADKALLYLDDKGYPAADGHNNDPRNSIYIADLEIDEENQKAIFLLNRGDPTIAASSFINTNTQDIRTPDIEDDETIGHSAHFIIDYDPASMIGDFYKCHLERMTTVSRTLVRCFLNKHLRINFENNGMIYQNKAGDDVDYRPIMKIEGFLSDSLENDLRTGTLTMVEFSKKEEEFDGIDLENREYEIRHRVQVKVSRENQNGLFDWIRGLKNQARDSGFDELQIHIRGLDGDRSVSPRFSTDMNEAADFLYMKVDTISDFPDELEQCTGEINVHIRDKMLGLG